MPENRSQRPPAVPTLLRWLPVWKRNVRVWRKLAGPAIIGNFGEPLLYLLALGFGLGGLVGEVQNMPYIVFLASGIVCSSAMFTASFEGMYSAYTRMAVQGTWHAMLATPLDVRDIVVGEVAWCGTKSLISATAILLVAVALGAVTSWSALWALPAVVLAGFCFASMALVVTAFARSYDFFLYYNTLFITPMLLMGGVFFPVERMPPPIQALSSLLPLTHVVALVRPLMTGGDVVDPLWQILVIVAYTLAFLWLATTWIGRRMTD
jgi:lipooligosaccharide transport system permease protein